MQGQNFINVTFVNVEYFFYKIYQFLHSVWDFIQSGVLQHIFKTILGVISIILIFIICYIFIRLFEMNQNQKKSLAKNKPNLIEEPLVDPRWENINKLISSTNQNDWRQAIIEADIILDEIVKRNWEELGENLGERLKKIEPSDFLTLDQAWEAHKVRNGIAHEGSGFVLTDREAKRVIGLYEQVFSEFGFI